ncbi:CbrC family protein [Streptomyces sp. BF23-18]|uniref:CbrC family protein n=1 Tax=Streptomyces sp. BF23-18 TaxID=3240282 RepID=UPI0034E3CBA9
MSGHRRFCPWCIADGSAAERLAGEFADFCGLDGVGEDVLREVTRRAPGLSAWQDPHRFVHCQDAAACGRGRIHRAGGASRSPRPTARRHAPRRPARRDPA